jgi:serine/threonine protein kinase
MAHVSLSGGAIDSDCIKELLVDNYINVEPLGRGAFGVVFRGVQRATGLVRAIKVVRVDQHLLGPTTAAASAPADFSRLAGDTFAIGLQHPYVAVVFDVGVLDHRERLVAITMELVPGKPLSASLFSERRRQSKTSEYGNTLLETGFVARVAACMLSALEYCSRRKIVHQDIQPDNILVHNDDGVPCKLIDFGFAKTVQDGAYLSVAAGMTAYSAPEKLRGEQFGTRADMYSLGIVIYEMTTLSLPEGDPFSRAKKKECITIPATFSVPAVYRRMVTDMLQSEPTRRPKVDVVSGRLQLTSEFRIHCRGRVEMMSGVTAMERFIARDFDDIDYLGGGAFGQVFKGRHRVMGGEWAIKVVDADGYIGEKLLVDVRHEHIARIMHIGVLSTEERLLSIQMELATGAPLRDLIEASAQAAIESGENSLVETGVAWFIMEALVRALACLEEHSIVHEDIKPDNVMVDKTRRLLKVIDFGLSVRAGEGSSDGGTRMYCAPEKLRGEDSHDCRADVYSAGAVMWEVVMLRPLSDGEETALARARRFEDSVLECSRPDWSRAVSDMLKSRAKQRPRARSLMASVVREVASPSASGSRNSAVAVGAWRLSAEVTPKADLSSPPSVPPRRTSGLIDATSPPVEREPLGSSGILVNGSGGKPPAAFGALQVVARIAEAVRLVPAGATIHILAGEYRESVVIDKDITLQGYSMSGQPAKCEHASDLPVHIIGNDSGPALRVRSSAVTIRGLFLESASLTINTVELIKWTGRMEDCRIRGRSTGDGWEWGGLVVRDRTGCLKRCEISKCEDVGCMVVGRSDITIERCRLSGSRFGMTVTDRSKVHAVGCECKENLEAGLRACGEGQLTATECSVTDNCEVGVGASQRSKLSLLKCEISRCGQAGLVAVGQSQVVAESCLVTSNRGFGVGASEQSSIMLRECECSHNDDSGAIAFGTGSLDLHACKLKRNMHRGACATEQSKLTMAMCECTDNLGSGVLASEESEVCITHCRIMFNNKYGVHLGNKSKARIEESECSDNDMLGFGCDGQSSTVVEKTLVLRNKHQGLHAADKAVVQIVDCDCSENMGSGVYAADESDVSVKRCTLNRNGGQGACAADICNLRLADCECVENKDSGFVGIGSGVPQLERCRLLKNSKHGLFSSNQCRIRVFECEMERNEEAGVMCTGQSNLEASRSRIMRNQVHGLYTDESAVARALECRFFENQGSGMCCQGDSSAFAQDCHLTKNEGRGLLSGGKASITLAACELNENMGSGLTTTESSAVSATNCKASRNSKYGVHVNGSSRVCMTECECMLNELLGIGLHETGELLMKRSKVRKNKGHGVCVGDSSKATLSACECSENSAVGLAALSKSIVSAESCSFCENEQHGLTATEQSQVRAVDCDSSRNKSMGILIMESSNLSVEKSIMKRNGLNGLCAGDSSGFSVVDCELSDCTNCGIVVAGLASGTMTRCKLTGCGAHGVYVCDGATLKLDESEMSGHGDSGCAVVETGSAVGTKLQISQNGFGLYLIKQSKSRFVDCDVFENTVSGLVAQDEADVVLERCQMRKNAHRGIDVEGQVKAQVMQCTCTENTGSGLVAKEHAEVVLGESNMVRNLGYGLRSSGEARVHMSDCDLSENMEVGVGAYGRSEIAVERCKMRQNAKHGVYVTENAQSRITDSVCAENAISGAVSSESSQCIVERSQLDRNRRYGARRYGSSTLVLLQHSTQGNGRRGVKLRDDGCSIQ